MDLSAPSQIGADFSHCRERLPSVGDRFRDTRVRVGEFGVRMMHAGWFAGSGGLGDRAIEEG